MLGLLGRHTFGSLLEAWSPPVRLEAYLAFKRGALEHKPPTLEQLLHLAVLIIFRSMVGMQKSRA